MDKFYCVSVSILSLGGLDKPTYYHYKNRKGAEEHIDQYRQETLLGRNDYQIVEDRGDDLLLRNERWTECRLRLTECYFED